MKTPANRILTLAAVALALWLVACQSGLQQPGSILDQNQSSSAAARPQVTTTETFVPTTIDYPGSTSTAARSINNSGDIVGTYSCAAACTNPNTGETSTAGTHGFLLQNGVFTRIDVPGAAATVARGISDPGVIVGHYTVAGLTHGFAYSDGNYVYPIDVPAADFDHPSSIVQNTLIVGISPEGDLVGCFHEDNLIMTTMHGWLRRNGSFSVLVTDRDTNSHDPDTMNNAIAPTGEIAGFYFSSGVSYLADRDGVVSTFTFPGNLFTLAWGINARGDIVGVRGDNQANTTGSCTLNPSTTSCVGFFRTKHGDYRSLRVQDASSTVVYGINALREIVGQYTDSTGTHGFTYRLNAGNQ